METKHKLLYNKDRLLDNQKQTDTGMSVFIIIHRGN